MTECVFSYMAIYAAVRNFCCHALKKLQRWHSIKIYVNVCAQDIWRH